MSDSCTEISSKSWFSRLGKSIIGVLVGLVLFLAAFPLLFWNEGRAVKTARSLEEGAANVVSIDAGKVDPANDGKLVHLSGEAKTDDVLKDPQFGAEQKALRMRRVVHIYQWKQEQHTEKRKKIGGSQETVTTYTYDKAWVNAPIDSSKFKEPEGHTNTGSMVYENRDVLAPKVTLGAFTLPAKPAAAGHRPAGRGRRRHRRPGAADPRPRQEGPRESLTRLGTLADSARLLPPSALAWTG